LLLALWGGVNAAPPQEDAVPEIRRGQAPNNHTALTTVAAVFQTSAGTSLSIHTATYRPTTNASSSQNEVGLRPLQMRLPVSVARTVYPAANSSTRIAWNA
jgi:hypothetical protein